VRQYPDLTSM